MSGICGIHEPGRTFDAEFLVPMLAALALPDESEREDFRSTGVALGVARRWPFQQGVQFAGVSVVADADLVERGAILHGLGLPISP